MCDHRSFRTFRTAALLVAAAALFPGTASAQLDPPPPPPADSPVVATVTPGAEYATGALGRFFFGGNWRDLWVRPVTAPVLDLDRFAGGLEPDHTGGNQTRTFHFETEDGKTYIFRSIHKYVRPTLPADLQGTLIQDWMEEFLSGLHPAGAFVVFPLQRELGLLTEPYWLVVMPDDPRLGEHREAYAGLLGQIVEQSNEGPDDTPGTFGYDKITGSDRLLERLEENPRHRVHERELLAAKLLDFIVGDTDRGLEDQWRWAGEDEADGVVWRPIPRDRDWAFMNAEGPIAGLARRWYEKVADYGPRHSSLDTYLWQDQGLSRRLLVGLDRAEWDAVVADVMATLSDDAIAAAVAQLPDAFEPGHAETLASALRQRRDALPALADEYYLWLAGEVDLHATDQDDRLEAVRHPDGSLVVTLFAPADLFVAGIEPDEDEDEAEDEEAQDGDAEDGQNGQNGHIAATGDDDDDDRDEARRGDGAAVGWKAYYTRRFLPSETDEVRVYMHGGEDVAVVRGEGSPITVRVIGGGGDDQLFDEGRPSRRTAFYDHRGDNRIVAGGGTHVSTEAYEPPEEGEGFFSTKTQDDRVQDWGNSFSWVSPVVDYREGAGVVVGAGPRWTDYGFRHHPYDTRLRAALLFGTRTTSFGVEAEADLRRENSPLHWLAGIRATPFEAMRFYGYGNDSPALGADESLVLMDQIRTSLALAWDGGWWDAAVGPVFQFTDLEPGDSPFPAVGTSADYAQAGGRLALTFDRADGAVPTRGFELELETSAFPALLDAAQAFGRSAAEARAYLGGSFASVALRAGGGHAWGGFPVHEAARIGGQESLRGYRWQRFAGDAAVYGGAELRLPLFRAELLTKGRLGILGLADAGRVYVDGESPGGWHAGYGAGLWFHTLGQAFSVTWARGEEDRFYLSLGMPF